MQQDPYIPYYYFTFFFFIFVSSCTYMCYLCLKVETGDSVGHHFAAVLCKCLLKHDLIRVAYKVFHPSKLKNKEAITDQ